MWIFNSYVQVSVFNFFFLYFARLSFWHSMRCCHSFILWWLTLLHYIDIFSIAFLYTTQWTKKKKQKINTKNTSIISTNNWLVNTHHKTLNNYKWIEFALFNFSRFCFVFILFISWVSILQRRKKCVIDRCAVFNRRNYILCVVFIIKYIRDMNYSLCLPINT